MQNFKKKNYKNSDMNLNDILKFLYINQKYEMGTRNITYSLFASLKKTVFILKVLSLKTTTNTTLDTTKRRKIFIPT